LKHFEGDYVMDLTVIVT